jgi:farnesyl diphosphate synthase
MTESSVVPYPREPFDPADCFPRLKAQLAAAAGDVEGALQNLLPEPQGRHARVQEAMRYAVFAGGKRLRPFLALESAALFRASRARALRVAAAIEALHTYSLVHDDLPAMDDDDLRRGQPTAHRKFDEATAILAGDALLTLAFEILSDPATHPSGEVRAELVQRLARAAGSDGMVGGQMIDMEAPQQQLGAAEIVDLQQRKTGALFEFSCIAGAVLAGREAPDLAALRSYAASFGLAFQIADDLIDALGSDEAAGKRTGKDLALGKATLVSAYGLERAQAEVRSLAEAASGALAAYGGQADMLRALPFYLLDRSH